MSNYLIINFRRFGDVLSTSHLIHSIKANNPSAKVSLLTFEETTKAAKAISNVDNLFTINRDQIARLRKNKLFSNAFALDILEHSLAPIKNQQWSNIINYSNDKVGSYICSYLKMYGTELNGVSFEGNTIKHSDEWSIVFNDVLTSYRYPSIHFQDCYHHLTQTRFQTGDKKSKISDKHEKTTRENINHIRTLQDGKKLIGIQLKSASETKDIPFDTLRELTTTMLSGNSYFPIFFIAPTDEERKEMQKLNDYFNSSLISVEADFIALGSVLRNIDLLITPDTSIKHLADINEVPLIEIALGEAPIFKQGTTTRGNLIITFPKNATNTKYAVAKDDVLRQNSNLKASDIINAINYYFLKIDKRTLSEKCDSSICVYEVAYDQKGIIYNLINHAPDVPEIKRRISREAIYRIIDSGKTDVKFFSTIKDFDKDALDLLITNEKAKITGVMKDLLSCLRALLKQKDQITSHDAPVNLFKSLDNLLVHTDDPSFASIPVQIFATKMESINSANPASGIIKLEKLLYDLKANVQILLNFMKEIEDEAIQHSNDEKIKIFQERRSTNTNTIQGNL